MGFEPAYTVEYRCKGVCGSKLFRENSQCYVLLRRREAVVRKYCIAHTDMLYPICRSNSRRACRGSDIIIPFLLCLYCEAIRVGLAEVRQKLIRDYAYRQIEAIRVGLAEVRIVQRRAQIPCIGSNSRRACRGSVKHY